MPDNAHYSSSTFLAAAIAVGAVCGISGAQVTTTVAGTNFTFPRQPLPARNAPLSTGLNAAAVDSSGNIYVADSLNNVVVRIGTDGTLSIVAGNGIYGFSGEGGPATSAALAYPTGVAVDSAGNVFRSDSRNLRVRVVSNGIITTVVGTGQQGYTGDGGPAINATLGSPGGLAIDSAGNLFIIDHTTTAGASAVIREVSNGKITTAVGGSAALNSPAGVAVDTAGNLYIADSARNKIFEASGGLITQLAGASYGYTGDGGPATKAAISVPTGIAVDASGNIYFADSGNFVIRKISQA